MSVLTQMIKTSNILPPTPAGIAQVVLSGLTSRFTADGTANDLLKVNNGTFTSPAYVAGKYGQAFSFTGSNYVSIPNSTSLNALTATWSFWIKGTTIPGTTTSIMGKTNATGSTAGINILLLTSGGLYIQIRTSRVIVIDIYSGIKVQDGNWHHMVFSFSAGSSYALYVDNVLTNSGSLGLFTFAAQPVRIARSLDGYWSSYPGAIDELRFYNRMITADEVNTLYHAL